MNDEEFEAAINEMSVLLDHDLDPVKEASMVIAIAGINSTLMYLTNIGVNLQRQSHLLMGYKVKIEDNFAFIPAVLFKEIGHALEMTDEDLIYFIIKYGSE